MDKLLLEFENRATLDEFLIWLRGVGEKNYLTAMKALKKPGVESLSLKIIVDGELYTESNYKNKRVTFGNSKEPSAVMKRAFNL